MIQLLAACLITIVMLVILRKIEPRDIIEKSQQEEDQNLLQLENNSSEVS